jgi:hypothetical protein
VEELVSVSLQGGPTAIPRTLSVERSRLLDGKLKIEHLGGYEHFERQVMDGDAGIAGSDVVAEIYHWTLRTKIAE